MWYRIQILDTFSTSLSLQNTAFQGCVSISLSPATFHETPLNDCQRVNLLRDYESTFWERSCGHLGLNPVPLLVEVRQLMDVKKTPFPQPAVAFPVFTPVQNDQAA